jgi:pimeloyl-ACP methyl ester carboxylesterase
VEIRKLLWVSLCLLQALTTGQEPSQSVSPDVENLNVVTLLRKYGRVAPTPPAGIDEKLFVPIGGIDQWITMRGQDRPNPVLLLLHDGPDDATNPWAYNVLAPWEKSFTLVQWDQRGAGKTLGKSGPSVASTITIDRMTQDGIELAEFLGADDYTCTAKLVREYINAIKAPRKTLVMLKGGGHFAVFMQPRVFLHELVTRVRPLALE